LARANLRVPPAEGPLVRGEGQCPGRPADAARKSSDRYRVSTARAPIPRFACTNNNSATLTGRSMSRRRSGSWGCPMAVGGTHRVGTTWAQAAAEGHEAAGRAFHRAEAVEVCRIRQGAEGRPLVVLRADAAEDPSRSATSINLQRPRREISSDTAGTARCHVSGGHGWSRAPRTDPAPNQSKAMFP
jgi:hypothetical protein